MISLEKLTLNETVKAEIKSITNYFIICRIVDSNVHGILHISEVSHSFVSNLKEIFKVGEIISVKIIFLDFHKKIVKLSVKDFSEKEKSNLDTQTIDETKTGFSTLHDNLKKFTK